MAKDLEKMVEQFTDVTPPRPPEAERTRRAFPVTAKWAEGDRYTGLRVQIDDPEFRQSFQTPGQYTTLDSKDGSPSYVVIANGPVSAPAEWEFLVHTDTNLGHTAQSIEIEDRVILSPAEGSGYPISQIGNQPVLCFTTGTGIASIRPVVHWWLHDPDLLASNLYVYYGEKHPAEFAYRAEVDEWLSDGIDVRLAAQHKQTATAPFKYVQNAVDPDIPKLSEALVFISGANKMIAHTVTRLLELGIEPRQIFTNI